MKHAFPKALAVAAIAFSAMSASTSDAKDLRKVPMVKSDSSIARTATRGPFVAVKIGCVVNGTPVEFPNDIWIVNQGSVATKAGLTVQWQTQNNAFSGVVTIPALQPGQGHFVSNALPGGLVAGTPCFAKLN